ncbi:MAG TPA: hypothetical protein EYP22_03235 [Methanosarcinales archaeon]|nr:hypothetical protein [Methanosarcinales archaeon]
MGITIENIPTQLHQKLLIETSNRNIKIEEVIIEALEQYFQRNDRERAVQHLHKILDKGIDLGVSPEVVRANINREDDLYERSME